MAIHITLFVLFFFACDAKGIEGIESLRREQEVFKKVILELKCTNENLNSKLTVLETTLKEDVKRLGAKVMHLENVNANLEQNQANLKENVNHLTANVINLQNENNILKSLFDLRRVGRNLHNVSPGNTSTATTRLVEKQAQESHDVILTDTSKYT